MGPILSVAYLDLAFSSPNKGFTPLFVDAVDSSYMSNMTPKSREILMIVCLQKDAKQCCDATEFGRTHCTGQFTPKMKANANPRLLSS